MKRPKTIRAIHLNLGDLVKITGGDYRVARRKIQGKYAIVVSDYYQNRSCGWCVDVCVSEAGGSTINTHSISPYYLERVN